MVELTNRARPVDRRPMSGLEKLYLWNILKGMILTGKHLFRRKVTVKYPEQKRSFPKVFRGLHVLNRDEQGREGQPSQLLHRGALLGGIAQSKEGARWRKPRALSESERG